MKRFLNIISLFVAISLILWGCKLSSHNETTTKAFNVRDYYITSVAKDDRDVTNLKNIIKELRSNGAKVSEDLDSYDQYSWDRNTGRLTSITWIDKDIKGELDLSKLDALTNINCSNNDITDIKLLGLNNLYELDCSQNKIKKLHLEELTELGVLECSYNQLEEIDLDNFENLIEFNCSNNNLKKLDISQVDLLEFGMDCSNNNLVELKLGESCLRYLDCSNNKLTYLDTSGLFEATALYCQNNELEDLKLKSSSGGAYYLELINCKNNKLSEINVKDFSSLKTIKRDENVKVIGWKK